MKWALADLELAVLFACCYEHYVSMINIKPWLNLSQLYIKMCIFFSLISDLRLLDLFYCCSDSFIFIFLPLLMSYCCDMLCILQDLCKCLVLCNMDSYEEKETMTSFCPLLTSCPLYDLSVCCMIHANAEFLLRICLCRTWVLVCSFTSGVLHERH